MLIFFLVYEYFFELLGKIVNHKIHPTIFIKMWLRLLIAILVKTSPIIYEKVTSIIISICLLLSIPRPLIDTYILDKKIYTYLGIFVRSGNDQSN